MKPVIYSTDDCYYCDALKDWLDEIGVEYDEIDAAAMDDIAVVPEVHIGEEVFVGFARRKILKSLRAHGIIKD